MPRVGFKAMTPLFLRANLVHALDRTTPVMGNPDGKKTNISTLRKIHTSVYRLFPEYLQA
jgi:hypothetical protein